MGLVRNPSDFRYNGILLERKRMARLETLAQQTLEYNIKREAMRVFCQHDPFFSRCSCGFRRHHFSLKGNKVGQKIS